MFYDFLCYSHGNILRPFARQKQTDRRFSVAEKFLVVIKELHHIDISDYTMLDTDLSIDHFHLSSDIFF